MTHHDNEFRVPGYQGAAPYTGLVCGKSASPPSGHHVERRGQESLSCSDKCLAEFKSQPPRRFTSDDGQQQAKPLLHLCLQFRRRAQAAELRVVSMSRPGHSEPGIGGKETGTWE